MLGHKAREFKLLTAVSLEDLVPEDNFYRQLERHLDLRFIHELVASFYSEIGRPSIDPVIFFKLQLIAFFEGIRSERQLMETVNLNLAHRWYIGYDLGETVPDHSSLSKIRERYGLEVFHRFFEHIVELCIQARLVWGEELYFDSTKVRANADIATMVDKVGMLVGVQNAVVGFIVHMVISAFIGAVYGLVAGRFALTWTNAVVGGIVNGLVWWLLGALTLMPLFLGMTQMIFVIGADQWLSLMGHILYGLVTAFVFIPLAKRN